MNNNTVTFIKLKEIFQYLWDRITTVFEYFEKDKASLNKNNVFVGTNTFDEVKLIGKNEFVETDGYHQVNTHPTDRYCGYRTVSTHSDGTLNQPKYVSSIRIDVYEGLNVGDTVGGVHIVEVEKSTSKLTDIVRDKITDGGSFVVEKDSRDQNVIYVPVQKEYERDTYFLIGQSDMSQMAQTCYIGASGDDSINGLFFENLPATGEPLNHSSGVNWVVRHALTTDDINVREELDKIKNLGSSTVTSVNNVDPINGNVTIGIGNINGLQGQLDGKVVTVNQQPQQGGNVTLNGTHINATVGTNTTSIQEHLRLIGIKANDNDTRLLKLERRHPTYNVGDIIPTFKQNAPTYYTLDGCRFMHCATAQLLRTADYPDYATALGVPTGTASFYSPVINDEQVRFDNNLKTATKRYYVCIKVL